MENKNSIWAKKVDWKFYLIILGIGFSIYKTILLSENHIVHLQKSVDKLTIVVNKLNTIVNKNSLLIERLDERTK